MLKKDLESLICHETNHKFDLKIFKISNDRVIDGILISKNKNWYKIEDTILDFTNVDEHNFRYYELFKKKYKLKLKLKKKKEIKLINFQKKFFNTKTYKYEKEITESPFSKTFDNFYLKKFIKKFKGKKIINIGGGSAREALHFSKANINVTIVDVSYEILKITKKKFIKNKQYKNVNLICGYAEKLNIRNNTFDGWIVYGAAHHFYNPKKSFLEAMRVTKRNGQFLVWEPSDTPLRKLFDIAMKFAPLWEEEDNVDFLFNQSFFRNILNNKSKYLQIRNLVLIPPHLYYINSNFIRKFLILIDKVICNLPFLKRLGGTILLNGTKK